ncbi:MAG TPA: NapC/NirT family cytochrome c [Anaerolineae bacterium]|nr:NapC/NirT family cytochrome c [Anaerolineae bacterium]
MFTFNVRDVKSRIRIPRLRLPALSGPSRRLRIPIAVAALVVLLLVIGYGFSYTSQPQFCATCHEMKPAFDSWQQTSLHAEVDCNTCHAPSLLSKVGQKVGLIGEIYRHFTGSYEQPINKDSELSKNMDSDSCLRCHTPKRIVTPRKTLVMNHNVHIEKGIPCTYCHNRAGHPSTSERKDFISMEGCFRCHGLSKEALAPGKCIACHPKSFDILPVTHKTGTWKVPDHGKTAKQDTTQCTTCHQKTFCRGCHGVEVPHPDKFVKSEHGSIGSKNPKVCQKCHRQKDFCNSCHHKGYNERLGNWVPTHKNVVAQVGPAYCFNCHGPTFCAYCHVRGEVQPRTQRPQERG